MPLDYTVIYSFQFFNLFCFVLFILFYYFISFFFTAVHGKNLSREHIVLLTLYIESLRDFRSLLSFCFFLHSASMAVLVLETE